VSCFSKRWRYMSDERQALAGLSAMDIAAAGSDRSV
jgi:hypothetical protein